MLGAIGKEVAAELNLPNPKTFTGHCFRHSSATAAANSGATSVDVKTSFGWKNEKTALQYIEGTKDRKRRMSAFLTGVNSIGRQKKGIRGML